MQFTISQTFINNSKWVAWARGGPGVNCSLTWDQVLVLVLVLFLNREFIYFHCFHFQLIKVPVILEVPIILFFPLSLATIFLAPVPCPPNSKNLISKIWTYYVLHRLHSEGPNNEYKCSRRSLQASASASSSSCLLLLHFLQLLHLHLRVSVLDSKFILHTIL